MNNYVFLSLSNQAALKKKLFEFINNTCKKTAAATYYGFWEPGIFLVFNREEPAFISLGRLVVPPAL
jgi:hypothetical protein